MAEQLKPKAKVSSLTGAKIRTGIDGINAEKAQASEYNGSAAKLTKDFAEEHNLDKKALTTVANLARKELAQAQATLRDILRLSRLYGLFDQIDAFADGDMLDDLEAILAKARQSEAA